MKTKIKKYTLQILNDTLKQISPLASYPILILIAIIFLLIEKYLESIQLILFLILSYSIAIPLRLIFFSERPIPKKHTNLIEKIPASSFPSLHSTRTAFLFLFFTNIFKGQTTIIIFLFTLSLILVYSRFHFKKHYLKDIIAGIIIGTIIYYLTNYIIY